MVFLATIVCFVEAKVITDMEITPCPLKILAKEELASVVMEMLLQKDSCNSLNQTMTFLKKSKRNNFLGAVQNRPFYFTDITSKIAAQGTSLSH